MTTLLLDAPPRKARTCARPLSQEQRRAVAALRRSVTLERKRELQALEKGSYWDRIDWSHIRVVLLGAKLGSGSLLALLPDSLIHQVLLIAARRRWRPTFKASPAGPRGLSISKTKEGASSLAFNCDPEVEWDEHRSFTFDGWGTQYIEVVLSDVYIGSSLVLARIDNGTPLISIDFSCERYDAEEEAGALPAMEDYWHEPRVGETTVTIDFHQPRAWKYRPAESPAEASDMVAHVTAWNDWDWRQNWLQPHASATVSLGLLVDFDESLMRLGIDGMPGPTVPFARDAPLRLGLDGFYGEQKAKEVLHDGSIRTKRVTISLRTDAPVPKAMLACRDVDEGTCDYLQCLACKYERAIEEQRAPTCPPCDGPP